MRGKFRFVVSALVMSVALVGSADAKKPKPIPCQPGRYLLPASIGTLTGDAGPEYPAGVAAGSIDARLVPAQRGTFKANKKGVTTVVAKSPPGDHVWPGQLQEVLVDGHAAERVVSPPPSR